MVEIAIVYPKAPDGAVDDRSPFVNVDTTTVAESLEPSKWDLPTLDWRSVL
jgi:hypothetical protein